MIGISIFGMDYTLKSLYVVLFGIVMFKQIGVNNKAQFMKEFFVRDMKKFTV